jgi:indolepyruvate ferredoxin oxidoreductase alpha subunit
VTSDRNGSQALAWGAVGAGVSLVTGYPGSPSTAVVEALVALQDQGLAGEGLHIDWGSNEKSAFDAALGVSLAGRRALVCLKNVGLNVALDSLMVANLAGGPGGLVVLVGDDPGGWGSQNEEDSRPLAAAAEVPLLEPVRVEDLAPAMGHAFVLSEQFQVPVVVRVTRAMTETTMGEAPLSNPPPAPHPPVFDRQPERWNVLPIRVVPLHRELQASLEGVQASFEASPFNRLNETGGRGRGIVAAGGTYQKLREIGYQGNEQAGAVVAGTAAANGEMPDQWPLDILALATLHPLPEERLLSFLRAQDAVLVVEETAPFVEIQLQALAQRAGLVLPILGRTSGHLPRAGELQAAELRAALAAFLPEHPWPAVEEGSRAMPSRQPLCGDCPYIATLRALTVVMERHGGREAFVVTGETGCMVRAQLPPWQILDAKYGMGGSIALAAGLVRSGLPQKVVALAGDSALLHSGLAGVVDAAQAALPLLVVVLDNGTTALSGGQPHPASGHDVHGRPRSPVDLAALLVAAGARAVHVVDPEDEPAMQAALEEGLAAGGVAVVIARRPCPRFPTPSPPGRPSFSAALRAAGPE